LFCHWTGCLWTLTNRLDTENSESGWYLMDNFRIPHNYWWEYLDALFWT
jgi:hypothetical protein